VVAFQQKDREYREILVSNSIILRQATMRTNLTRHQDGFPLERLLTSNPFVLLVGVGVGVATVIAGVMTYLNTQKIETLEIQHKTEITELKDKGREELFEVTQPLKAKIEDLSFRLSSIERRVPGAGPSYLDVSTVAIGPEARRTLGAKYISYDNGGFFLAVPDGLNWTFSLTNELDLLKSIYSFMDIIVKASPQLQAISQAPIFVWKSSSELKISTKMFNESVAFTYHPTVSVQHIDQNLLKDRIKLAKDMDSASEDKSQKNTVSKIGPKLDEQKEVTSDGEQKTIIADDKNESMGKIETQKFLGEAKKKQDLIEILDKLSANDLATFEFLDTSAQLLMQNKNFPLHNKILSAQKKGNVFYLQLQVDFRDVSVTVNGGQQSKPQNASVDEEIFFFGRGVDAYLVKVILPPVPDRADNFA